MRSAQLIRRSLTYHWRTNIAVVLGVATAVAVLAGALLVGESVRGSLRDLVVQRLGRTDLAIVSPVFFREQLAGDLSRHSAFGAHFADAAPLIAIQGVVTAQDSGRRVGRVRVYGIDNRFWKFHGVSPAPALGDREALVNEALARQLGIEPGAAVLVRVERPTAMPLESLHGKKDDLGRTMRLTVRGVQPTAMLGQFSLDAQQSDVLAVFVPLAHVQEEIEVTNRVNTLLVSAKAADGGDLTNQLAPIVRAAARIEDVGLKVRPARTGSALIVESDAGLITDSQAPAIEGSLSASGLKTTPIFTYLANTIRDGDREIPYSLVSAVDLSSVSGSSPARPGTPAEPARPALPAPPASPALPALVLNEWAAADLRAKVGDEVRLDYFVWEEPGRLNTHGADFQIARIVPNDAGDPDLAPTYPGITDSATLSEWDPPFPVDLRRVRPADEAYWNRYRTTPKAFISLEEGQRLWRTRYGAITSIRATGFDSIEAAREQMTRQLTAAIDPLTMGLAVHDVRQEGIAASRGATDFGEYFVYFSFFLVVSALLLAALFFKLGIEQRAREVGLLGAVGLPPRAVRRVFLIEGALLALAGSALGALGAVAYAALLMVGLRTWWHDAVGTTALSLHVSSASLVPGMLGGILAALACIRWTLRSLSTISERSLLAGELHDQSYAVSAFRRTRLMFFTIVLTLLAVGLMTAGVTGRIDATGAFFGAGSSLLVASLCAFAAILRRPVRREVMGHGWWPVSRLGMRSVTHRPGRSVLSMAVIASATFILIAVSAFRRDSMTAIDDPHTGTGGYELMVETLLPVVHDPNGPEGRESLNLFDLDRSTAIEPFRLLPGDDASCLNLYEPRNPRIIAPRESFIASGRFRFQDSLASSPDDRANPWRLLNRNEPDGAIPVVADANSMTYVLHRQLGETLPISHGGDAISLRFVASLSDSIFQGELIMSQANFLKLFPEQEGYSLLLVDTDRTRAAAVRSTIQDALQDYGANVSDTAERLAEFHRVENTYLSTFQTLGGLGLLLGTVGLATVLLRNVLERRRELGLLGAVGYGRVHFLLMATAENSAIVVAGLAAGAISALMAIAPTLVERGGRFPFAGGALLLLFGMVVVALLSSIAATAAATRAPVLESLRAE